MPATRVGKPAATCAESADRDWRTTKSHTVTEMMEVYREMFFAGFPAATADPEGGPPRFVPEPLVRSLFERFGAVTSFQFDERRGVGRATFADGDAAEHCYMALSYNAVRLPMMTAGGGPAGNAHDTAIVCLEFAEYLPFVNPWLIRDDLLTSGSCLSRQMLRTFPRRRGYSNTTGRDEGSWATTFPGVADTFLGSDAMLESKRLGLPEAQRASCSDTRTLSMMDVWHSYFVQHVQRGPSLYADVRTAYLEGVRCVVDVTKIAAAGNACYVAAADLVKLRRGRARVNVRPLLESTTSDDSATDHGSAFLGTIALLSMKANAVDEPGRAAALGAVKGVAAAAVYKQWASDEMTALLAETAAMIEAQEAADDVDAAAPKKKAAPLRAFADPCTLCAMALNLMYRSASPTDLGGPLRMIDERAASGASSALLRIAGPVSEAEVTANAAHALRRYGLLKDLWQLARYALMSRGGVACVLFALLMLWLAT